MFFQTTLCARTSKMKTKRISDLRWYHPVLDIIQTIFTFRHWRALKPKCMMKAQMASRDTVTLLRAYYVHKNEHPQ